MQLQKTISEHPIALFLPVAIISIGLAGYYYKKLSPYWFMSMMLFFVHNYLYRDINQMRSAILCAIGLVILVLVYKRRRIASFLVILFGSLFHMVGISYMVSLFFNRVSQNRRFFLLSIILAVFISISGFVSILVSKITFLGFISTKLLGYMSTDRFVNSVGLFDVTNLKNLLIFLLCYCCWDKLRSKSEYFEICFTFFTFGTVWRLAFSELGIIAARIATVFTITEVILIPMLVTVFKQKLIPVLFVILYSFLMLYINLFLKDGRHPYNTSFGGLW